MHGRPPGRSSSAGLQGLRWLRLPHPLLKGWEAPVQGRQGNTQAVKVGCSGIPPDMCTASECAFFHICHLAIESLNIGNWACLTLGNLCLPHAGHTGEPHTAKRRKIDPRAAGPVARISKRCTAFNAAPAQLVSTLQSCILSVKMSTTDWHGVFDQLPLTSPKLGLSCWQEPALALYNCNRPYCHMGIRALCVSQARLSDYMTHWQLLGGSVQAQRTWHAHSTATLRTSEGVL